MAIVAFGYEEGWWYCAVGEGGGGDVRDSTPGSSRPLLDEGNGSKVPSPSLSGQAPSSPSPSVQVPSAPRRHFGFRRRISLLIGSERGGGGRMVTEGAKSSQLTASCMYCVEKVVTRVRVQRRR